MSKNVTPRNSKIPFKDKTNVKVKQTNVPYKTESVMNITERSNKQPDSKVFSKTLVPCKRIQNTKQSTADDLENINKHLCRNRTESAINITDRCKKQLTEEPTQLDPKVPLKIVRRNPPRFQDYQSNAKQSKRQAPLKSLIHQTNKLAIENLENKGQHEETVSNDMHVTERCEKQPDPKIHSDAFVHLNRCKKVDRLSENDSNIKTHLRKRKIKDYKVLLNAGAEFEEQKKHVPIYLQKPTSKEHTSKDPFKFVNERSNKPKTEDNSDSDSSDIEKVMQDVRNYIKNKEKKTKSTCKKMINRKENVKKLNNDTVNVKKKVDCRNGLLMSTPIAKVIDTNLPTKPESPPKHINIISNVIIPPLENPASPVDSLDDYYEDTNSFHHTEDVPPSPPWRGDDLNLRRNPHWLILKDTSLPYYNQEMILKPELVEKSSNKSISKETSYVQTSLTDFITCEKDSPVKVTNRTSLFDAHEFSPIKSKEKRTTITPIKFDNSSSLFDEISFSSNTSKRNILGALNENRVLDNVQNIHNNYSFGFTDDEGKENTPKQFKNKNRSPNALPMRVSVTDVKIVQNEAVEQLLEDLVMNQSLSESLPVADANESIQSVGLFEDPEPPQVAERTYISKRRRRVRIASVEEEDQEEKPKKKKKDVRTKAEEEAFKKWVESFNAMCNEVEGHDLEIE